ELVSRSLQPVLWLMIFGEVFNRIRAIPTGGISYLAFMAPGVLAQSVLFSAIFFGIAVIWERDLGIVHKLLVSPAFRVSLVLGKAISAGFRGLVQATIVYILALLIGVEVSFSPMPLLGVGCLVVLGSATFSTFSLIIACWVRTRERFMGIGQVLTMPLFFASNAIYPLSLMPNWLQWVARFNPLTYLVDGLRTLMVVGSSVGYGLATDFSVLVGAFVLLLLVAALLYPNLAR
ncbi:MAG TPA: ABC transporter permease, partial [bacterium]|nr:ABC transporter permease [bacterium]